MYEFGTQLAAAQNSIYVKQACMLNFDNGYAQYFIQPSYAFSNVVTLPIGGYTLQIQGLATFPGPPGTGSMDPTFFGHGYNVYVYQAAL